MCFNIQVRNSRTAGNGGATVALDPVTPGLSSASTRPSSGSWIPVLDGEIIGSSLQSSESSFLVNFDSKAG